MDHIGTMTRSVADAGLMLHAIAGPDPNDPTTLPHSVPEMLDKLGQELTGIRIGFDQHYATSDVDPELVAAVGDSVDVLVDLGAELVEIELPDIDPFVLAWPVLCTAEAVLAHQATYPLQRETYGPWFRGWLDKGANVTGADYARANNLRVACNGHFQRAISEIDILVCPSMSAPPHPVTAETLYGPMTDRPPKFQRFTVPFNYNGMPTLSLPCGFTSDHLPLSLQLVGKHLSEPLLCQVGHAYQQASTWHQRHPDLERVRTAN
jgi:amidase